MRIHLQLSPSTTIVPFDNQYLLMGVLHKWLGENAVHDDISLYSYSWLQGGVRESDGLAFPKGAKWFVSAYDGSLIKQVIDGIRQEPSVVGGMQVQEVVMQETPEFTGDQRFKVASPVLAKQFDGESVRHRLFDDEQATDVLTRTLRTKLGKAGLSSEGVKVGFDESYPNPATKLVTIKGIANRASVCPVVVDGPPEAVRFAWDVGVGHLTGCGFGALW